ncbi:MAG: biopolymer transporter ExbD [Prevotella sp.]|nr:biopolymer transporter ExbD [Prevotella sp.]MCM1074495.1 biopolymer transporter ExbD [Ruminococcus sp.]
MSLKRQFNTLSAFSMSSMADVIFLLLIFFMITSTLIIPSALDVNLPESTEQTMEKPKTEVYIDSLSQLYLVADRNDSIADSRIPHPVSTEELQTSLVAIRQANPEQAVALYADSIVPYASVIRVLDMAASNDIKIVLATHPVSR